MKGVKGQIWIHKTLKNLKNTTRGGVKAVWRPHTMIKNKKQHLAST